MNKIYLIVAAVIFYFISFTVCAQQKYALLVGINKYYKSPGVLYESELRGCVNDAFAMKGTLQHRFGFEEENITVLSDEKATSQNVVAAFLNILNKARAGDAFVFYFSGHGVWMRNFSQSRFDQQVKDRMNQAMVMSNLYAPDMKCLLRDNELKMLCNKFIDKKVISTCIIDCCFSGNLDMQGHLSLDDEPVYYHVDEIRSSQKSIGLWEIENISPTTVSDPADSIRFGFEPDEEKEFVDKQRSFSLKDAIIIHDSLSVTRPSERPNSMFLAFGATNDRQPGLEIMDETGSYHGAYTMALLHTIKKHPSDFPAGKIFEELGQLLIDQHYDQSPMHHEDPARLNKNLIGITDNSFKDAVMVNCTSVNGTIVQLDGGLYDGLAKGNLLSKKYRDTKIILQVNTIENNKAEVKIISGNIALIKPGDQFIVTDNYTISQPVIKICLPQVDINTDAYVQFFNKEILPLSKQDNYWHYRYWKGNKSSQNIFINNVDRFSGSMQLYKGITSNDNFFIFLPVPSYIANKLLAELRLNQNIQLVNSEPEADFTLYLNYVPASTGKPGEFIFTFRNFSSDVETGNYFFDLYKSIPNIQPDNMSLKRLAREISVMANSMAKSKSSKWLNDYLLR